MSTNNIMAKMDLFGIRVVFVYSCFVCSTYVFGGLKKGQIRVMGWEMVEEKREKRSTGSI